jgi:hypothetical protein
MLTRRVNAFVTSLRCEFSRRRSRRKGVRSNWAGLGYWARSQCGGTRPHCGPPVRCLRTALRDFQCAFRERTAVKSSALRFFRAQCVNAVRCFRAHCAEKKTALRTALPQCALRTAHSAAALRSDRRAVRTRCQLCAPHCERSPKLAHVAARLWLCPSETRSSLLDCGGPGATY